MLHVRITAEAAETALSEIGGRLDASGVDFVTQGGKLLARLIDARAPKGPTGDLSSSAGIDSVVSGGGHYSATVGPRTPYARRIELGFHGADSLGRHFSQGGRHYTKTAIEASPGPLGDLLTQITTEAIEG